MLTLIESGTITSTDSEMKLEIFGSVNIDVSTATINTIWLRILFGRSNQNGEKGIFLYKHIIFVIKYSCISEKSQKIDEIMRCDNC